MNEVRHKVFISSSWWSRWGREIRWDLWPRARCIYCSRTWGWDGARYYWQRQYRLCYESNPGAISKGFYRDNCVDRQITWARRYVDWEIQASLRHGKTATPNGLLGLVLPSAGKKPKAPDRLSKNLLGKNSGDGYARWYWYPQRKDTLAKHIEDAFQARTSRAHLIVNPQERFKNSRKCP